jgi:uncharacterized protein (UPF0212 family)
MLKAISVREGEGLAHCPMCTHTVPAQILMTRKGFWVKPGQKCPRCNGNLDAAYVVRLNQAA